MVGPYPLQSVGRLKVAQLSAAVASAYGFCADARLVAFGLGAWPSFAVYDVGIGGCVFSNASSVVAVAGNVCASDDPSPASASWAVDGGSDSRI